jgi:3',5'-cyclic AMP phosphodiesterase CpdA
MNNQRCTRRTMMGMTAGGLLAAGLWPGALRAEGAGLGEDFNFLAVNDLHYVDAKCAPWFERVIAQMKQSGEKIDLLLVSGDLADNGTPDQHHAIQEQLKGAGVPYYVVIGNHDYGAGDDRKAYDAAHPGRVNYHFEHRGWQLLGLDTSDGTRYENTSVQPHTLRWLDETLPKLDPRRPTIVFSHFPMGEGVKMRPKNADALLERFQAFNLQAVLNGHFHGFTERHARAATLTTNRCCSHARGNHDGTKEKGYFLCRAREGKIARTFVEVTE